MKKLKRLHPPPHTHIHIITREAFIGELNFSCHFQPILFSTKFWKEKLNSGKNLHTPAVPMLLGYKAWELSAERALEDVLHSFDKDETLILARALSWDVLNGIFVDLVLCGERKCKTCMIYWATNCSSSIRCLRALCWESLVVCLKFIAHRWKFNRTLAGAVSRCLLNGIVVVIVDCRQMH